MNKRPLWRLSGTHRPVQQPVSSKCSESLTRPATVSRPLGIRTLLPATLLCLLTLLSGCVSGSPVLPNPYVPCYHPRVSVATMEGLTQGLLDYADSVDLCNALNGQPYVEAAK
jgi:hypothetical protein